MCLIGENRESLTCLLHLRLRDRQQQSEDCSWCVNQLRGNLGATQAAFSMWDQRVILNANTPMLGRDKAGTSGLEV